MEEFVCESQPIPSDHLVLSLATVIGRGKINGTAVSKAKKLAGKLSASMSLPEIVGCGFTEKQATVVLACLRLGQEICSSPYKVGERFSNSRELFHRYRARFYSVRKEYFICLNLNSKNQLIREVLVSVGSLSTSVVHPREVFAPAVRDSAAAVIFMHNHPSGDPCPSKEDIQCTGRLCQAGNIIGIRVLDHCILGFDDYYSFADSGSLISE